VFVISGPSGVGKGTLVSAVRSRLPGIELSVSATTRAPRPGEADGREYFFVDDARFDQLVATDALLEWAQYAGTRYGTPREQVQAIQARGHDVILEIEVQGARQVRQHMPDATLVFIAPPSLDALRARLAGRGTESPERVAARLAAAESELAAMGEFDAVVVNDQLDRATDDLVELINRSRASRRAPLPTSESTKANE